MGSKYKIIQWNCRSVKPRFEELLLLLSLLRPSVFCLQETFLKPNDTFTFKGFNVYNHIHSDCLRASGGSSLLVHSSLPQRQIKLKTDLQAVAVSITLDKEITFCSIYIPPSYFLRSEQLTSLLQQLPSPYMLVGDFNGHNVLWGSNDNDPRGELIEDFITENDICLMNDKSNTYLISGKGTFSSLDLSLCHPSLYLDYEWSVCEDQHGSDHFPILIESVQTHGEDHNPKWKLHKADWDLFNNLCNESLTDTSLSDSSDPITDFTSSLIAISEKCIPKTSTNPKKSNPWYNDDCKESIKQRKDTLSKFCKFPTHVNLNIYRNSRAKARRTIKSAKRKSWRTYVSNLNYKTPTKKVWDMVRKISGKSKSATYHHLNYNFNNANETASTKQDIADTLASQFCSNSSTSHYSEEFQKYKKQQEKTKLNFKSSNNEEYNTPFNLDELKDAISKAHDTATGPDEVHYQMLKHLPPKSLQALLDIFNDMWETGKFPESWELATVIPIPKPGKDHAEPNSYRPIALTSCLCKTLERMINVRLVWYLESNNLISPVQSGFHSERSTNDNLVRLETFIRDAFVAKEHVVAVFFDLEKAYDTTWRQGIMRDLHDLGIRGRLATFIENFLADRWIQVRVGSTLSEKFDQAQGVPQGSILSTTLFNIKINSIMDCLDPKTDGSLYVDDFCMCYRSKSMRTIERHLQQCINRIENWASHNGFKFSKSKTQCVHFCQLRKVHNDPELYLYGSLIPVVENFKFLGVLFDRKLSFIPHIKYLKAKCLKALNLLKVLSHTDWGADRTVLLQLYRSLIRSKLDYGSIVYGSARPSYISSLDTVHHQGLRLALGAFRTSPVQSLYVEAEEPSLYLRREKLALQYAIRIAANPSNPVHKVSFPPYISEKVVQLYESKPKVIRSFGLRVAPLLESANIQKDKIEEYFVSEIPSWCIRKPEVNLTLHSGKKSKSNPHLLKESFHQLQSQFIDYQCIYTDGSKEENKVGCATFTNGNFKTLRLPYGSSIFTAEAKAIDLALDFINECNSKDKFIIFSDSMSVLQALNHTSSKNPQIQKLLIKHHTISELKTIIYCWVPSHVGIYGNEKVDKNAKESLNLEETVFKIPYVNFKPFINEYISDKWQTIWNGANFDKLREVEPIVKRPKVIHKLSRREEIVLARLRIGHTRITHSHLLKREDQPKYIGCDTPFTVKHFLLECTDFAAKRVSCFQANNLRELFKDVPVGNILSFLRQVNLFYKI